MLNKTHKGIELIQFLMLHDGQPVPNQRLLATLWSEDKSSNPESALKTLISRTRAMLNQISPGFGGCIAADRGAYHWEAAEGMIIDVYEVQRIYDQLMKSKDDTAKWLELMPSFMEHYTGDLLAHGEQKEWALSRAQALHTQYLSVVYTYVEMLKAAENYKEVVNVCRAALDVDNFDDKLHIIDFKYGQGIFVEAEHNPQMMLYALGALEIYDALYDIKEVSMRKCQYMDNSN